MRAPACTCEDVDMWLTECLSLYTTQDVVEERERRRNEPVEKIVNVDGIY